MHDHTKLTDQEKTYLIMSIKADRDMVQFLTGFAKPTKEQIDKKAFYTGLIHKIELI